MDAPAEVCNLDRSLIYPLISFKSYQTIKQVLGLDVTMNDIFRVQILKSFAHLTNVVSSTIFGKAAIQLLFKILV